MDNPFVLDDSEYKRDIHLVPHYVRQAASYLQLRTNRSFEDCKAFVLMSIKKGGEFEFKDPQITFYYRENFEDRVKTEAGVLEYIEDSLKKDEIIAPTLTTYCHPRERESLYVDFIDTNVKNRSVAKKKMFSATMEAEKYRKQLSELKDTTDAALAAQIQNSLTTYSDLAKIQNGVQANNKISNNSLSGAHVSASTPLFNKTSHSSLTSTCRITSGLGNANNEKFIAGNRHYHSYDVTLNNIISIVTNTDYNQLQDVVVRYALHIPSVDEAMQVIRYSTSLYWREKSKLENLEKLVAALSGLQRAAFVYTGDFYQLRQFNPTLIRDFLKKLSSKIQSTREDLLSIYKSAPDPVQFLAVQICNAEMKGVSIRDAFGTKKEEDGHETFVNPLKAQLMAGTIENIQNTIQEYGDLIQTLWTSQNFPASVGYLPDSVRRVVLVSDTDSTIFTVQEWVQWYHGKIDHSDESLGICASVVFLASQTITHLLAMMSANLGVIPKRLHQIAMKNEYRFDVFVPTSITKHYYAYIGFREGNLLFKYKPEIKGVHLKSSNAPHALMEKARALMCEGIMGEVIREKKISLEKILLAVADIEREVIASVRRGEYDYLRLTQIKESESYRLDDHQSPFQHYTLWNEVFGPKYGEVPPPPYTAIKVSTILSSKKNMQIWLESLPDQELAARMRVWLAKNDKKNGIGTLQLPDMILSAIGLPDEVFTALDIRRIILDATGVFYHILETLGVYMLDKDRTKLCLDYY